MRGARDRELALGMGDARKAHRCEHQGKGKGTAEKCGRGVDFADVGQNPRPKLEAREGVAVAALGALILRGAVDVVETAAR